MGLMHRLKKGWKTLGQGGAVALGPAHEGGR